MNKYQQLILVAAVIVAGSPSGAGQIRQGLPRDKIDAERLDPRLEFARMLYNDGQYRSAANEINRKIEADSSLLPEAARLFGGNYHLVRLTDNIFADRVGGFSPSGNKIIYARDTSFIRHDDGVFDWYEDRTTGIICYDFNTDKETEPEIPQPNPCQPRFYDEKSFFYLSQEGGSESFGGTSHLYLFDMELGISIKCFSFNGRNYSPFENGLVIFDSVDESIVMKNVKGTEGKVLFDNKSITTLKRPLPLIQNISAGDGILLFEAGYTSGRVIKNIYGIPSEGGKPRVMITERKEYSCDNASYPAAINESEFAYLSGDIDNIDVHYRRGETDSRLTFDGGMKQYLAISPDGLKIAYSYMIEKDGIESFEIFILDFAREATAEDIMYRINNIQ